MERLDQFRRLEVREKVRSVFVMSLSLSDHQVIHNIESFFLFSLVFRTSKLLEFKEFNKTIIPFALVRDMRLVVANARSWNNC